jgi:adenosylcobinamide-GDP ribazoletransferase
VRLHTGKIPKSRKFSSVGQERVIEYRVLLPIAQEWRQFWTSGYLKEDIESVERAQQGKSGKGGAGAVDRMKGFLLAVQFLTIIPVRLRGTITERQIAGSGVFFPLVGAFQGIIAAAAAFLLAHLFPVELVSGIVVLLLTATNGGFHLDGLADTFDAIAVKSTGEADRDRERRLAVMKDSATGAIGVVAIVMAVLLKYLLISSVFRKYDSAGTAYLLFLMPVFAKWSMIPVMAHGRPARGEGLGRMFIDGTGPKNLILSSLLLAAVYSLATFLFGFLFASSAIMLFIIWGLLLYAFSLLWTVFCSKRFGGLTGDTTGAVAEIGDMMFLIIALLSF